MLAPDRYNDVVAKLHQYTGLSDQYIRNSNLRIPYDRFENELLRERGVAIGRIDARFQTTVLDRPEVSPDWDATDAAIDSAFSRRQLLLAPNAQVQHAAALSCQHLRLIYADGETWDFKHGPNAQSLDVAPDLAQAMAYNPNLKVFSANGYYDFATRSSRRFTRSTTSTWRRRCAGTLLSASTNRGTWSISIQRRWSTSTTTSNAGMQERSIMRSALAALAAAFLIAAAPPPPAARPTPGPNAPDAVRSTSSRSAARAIRTPRAQARSRSRTTKATRPRTSSTRPSRSTASIRARVR